MNSENRKHVIAISYARRIFEKDSREQLRMLKYAERLEELHIIVFTRKDEGFSRLQLGNLYMYPTSARTKLGMLVAAYRIGRKIRKSKTGVCWVVSSQDPFETSLVGRAIAFGGNSAHQVQMHGDLFNLKSHNGSILSKLRVMYGKYVIKHADGVRVVSKRVESSIRNISPDTTVEVIPIMADLDAFLEAGEKRSYGLDREVKFLYVGRFSEEKNIPLIVKSFAEVRKEFPASLTLLGDGPKKEEIVNLIGSLHLEDSVSVSAWSNAVTKVMLEHDVLCLASHHEGWGMVLLEAAAAGMSCVSTEVGCVGEVVIDGDTGSVTRVGDEEEYKKAMMVYCANPALIERQGRRGHQVAKTFAQSEEDFVSKVVDAYPSCTS